MDRERLYAVLGGLLVGVAAAYFLDPVYGRARRERVVEDLTRLVGVVEHGAGGGRAETPPDQDPLRLFLEGRVSDTAIYDRVRAALRHLSSRPDEIRVLVRDGVVTLEGRVPESEVTDVVFGVRRVPGLVRLESRMEAILRGSDEATRVDADLAPQGAAAVQAALGVAAVALTRPHALAGLAFVLGAGFGVAAARGWRREARERRLGTVRRSVEVEAPVEQVFAFWTSFRNLPRFVEHLLEVRELEGGVSHWVGEDRDGNLLTWNVEITALKPHRRLSWRSLEGSEADLSGEVLFERLSGHRTRVTVCLTGAEEWLGADPEAQLAADLERMRVLLWEPQPVLAAQPA